ncbi:Carbonic anhydrase precursor [Flavobacterium columnare]|uniref:carbonic anhydrase n=2 Tax=Flavobacterium TaxID=237 RepID=A0A2N9P7U8_9FLAO|nr:MULTISPECIES: carbonic anhydrase family protein [Flavobacterium]QYS89722.1 carbonic anhydrase family protein [Flavobacterium davisii]RVU91455.1 carbonic anhydrase family protein [Flavobacterium columnare]SPE76427.1 Carbonic anhydrase precursor [Flavobacterium columnare]
MKTKKFYLSHFEKSVRKLSMSSIMAISLSALFISCSVDKDDHIIDSGKEGGTSTSLTRFPSDLISTPIFTSNFPPFVIAAQTPIDIPTSNLTSVNKNDLEIHYGKMLLSNVTNNGNEELKINLNNTDTDNNYITISKKKYNLVNIHFHYNSEHKIDGVYSKMEIHLVNKSVDNSYAVLGVLVELGSANSTIQKLFENSPKEAGQVNMPNITLSIAEILPEDMSKIYSYTGSLTTPNFGTNSNMTNGGPVTWFVFKSKQEISSTQFNFYKSIYKHPNFRNIQPLNNRRVYIVK